MSPIKTDERVIFFPTAARISDDRGSWIVRIHGWIFEPEENDLLRQAMLGELHEVLDRWEEPPATKIFDQRLRPFLVDNERGKSIGILIAGQQLTLPPSTPDGHFIGTIVLPADAVEKHRTENRLGFRARTSPGDDREFRGLAHLVPPQGVTVISDIDDTIKISNVLDKRALIQNTFFREFRAVDGMAAAFQRWAEAGADFHFVSTSPWQLYEPLSEFTQATGFPDACFHLKRFRLKDSSIRALFEDPLHYKVTTIEPLLQDFPTRKFLLVGDSGEKDPEAYATLARRHPDQITRIYIRDVTFQPADAPRYRKAFRDVPPEKWHIFSDPAALTWPAD